MPLFLVSRPLALAGPAAVAGVLLAQAAPPWPAIAYTGLLLWILATRSAGVAVLLAAFVAGHLAGARVIDRVDRTLGRRGGGWPHAPPRAATCDLEVTRCGEDPIRRRAWLEGRLADGIGVLCAWPGAIPAALGPGARVRVAGRFYLPRGPGNPGEPDRRIRYAARGVVWRADLRTVENAEIVAGAPAGPRSWLDRARRAAARRLARDLPPDVAPIALALLLGVRGGIALEDRRMFERTGTLHVLAISGMHVLLLAGVVHRLLRACGAGMRTAAGVTLALALLYVPVAGGAPPIRRAVTMLVFYGIALARGRPPDAASALGGAALTLALADPIDVFGVGFRLSFAAATGIAWLAPAWAERWSRRHRLLARFPAVRQDRPVRLLVAGYVLQAFPVALAAWLTTQPFVAASFGLVTPLAPPTNVVLGPLVALLLPVVALVACGCPALAGVVGVTVEAARGLLRCAGDVPGGVWLVVAPSTASITLWIAGCAALRPAPRLGTLVLLVAATWGFRPPVTPGASLALLDVGNGQALVLRATDGRAILVDAGSRSRPNAGRYAVLPALRALRIARLEAVICTHADADHWNALPDVLAAVPVGRVIVGRDRPAGLMAAARRYGVAVERAWPGDVVLRDNTMSVRVLAAGPPDSDTSNDHALALLLVAHGHRVMLPADREAAGLRALLAAGVPRCETLVAPHHGARCENAAAFGAAVRPELLLVSAAPGFADPATLNAYGATAVHHTARDGCVIVRFSAGERPRVETFRACYDPPP